MRSAQAREASPPPDAARAQTGICHVSVDEPSEPTGRNRFCGERELGSACAAALQRHVEQRHPRLVEKRRERRRHAGPALGFDGRKELLRGSRPVGVRLHVAPDAGLELRGADPRFEHRDDGAALLIRDRVERVGDVVGGFDLLADLARRHERVVAHDVGPVDDLLDRRAPGGLPLGDRAVRHPGGEGLVEPDVVPPRERHVVAEPLVRDLVRVDRSLETLPLDRLVLGLRQQDRLRPGHEPRVLHRAEGHRLRDDELVELRERDTASRSSPRASRGWARSSRRRNAPAEAFPFGTTMRIGVFFMPARPAST